MAPTVINADNAIKTTTEKREPLPEYLDESQYSQNKIETIIRDIQSVNKDKESKMKIFEEKYPEFAEKYPILFDMACNKTFDYETFNYMMSMRNQIAKKQRTVESASVVVGQKFYDMYMKKD